MTARISARLIAATWLAIASPVAFAQTPAPARSIHERVLPFDVHLDIDTGFDAPGTPATVSGITQFDLAKTARGGIKAAGVAIFVPQEDETPAYLAKARAIAEAKHRIIAGLADHYPDKVERALTPDDVRRIAASGKLAIVETVVNGGAFVASIDDLDRWQKNGVRDLRPRPRRATTAYADSSRPQARHARRNRVEEWRALAARQAGGRAKLNRPRRADRRLAADPRRAWPQVLAPHPRAGDRHPLGREARKVDAMAAT
jgi:membrane dipeptidase